MSSKLDIYYSTPYNQCENDIKIEYEIKKINKNMFSSDEIQFSVKKSIKDKNLSHNKLINEGFVVYISD